MKRFFYNTPCIKGCILFNIISLSHKGATPIPIMGNSINNMPVFSYQVTFSITKKESFLTGPINMIPTTRNM